MSHVRERVDLEAQIDALIKRAARGFFEPLGSSESAIQHNQDRTRPLPPTSALSIGPGVPNGHKDY
jgi:hypothetical protein